MNYVQITSTNAYDVDVKEPVYFLDQGVYRPMRVVGIGDAPGYPTGVILITDGIEDIGFSFEDLDTPVLFKLSTG